MATSFHTGAPERDLWRLLALRHRAAQSGIRGVSRLQARLQPAADAPSSMRRPPAPEDGALAHDATLSYDEVSAIARAADAQEEG